MRMLQYFFYYYFLATKSWKNHPQKLLRSTQFFSPIAAQTAQTEESIFQNLAYRATAYKIESKVSFFKTIEKPLKIKNYHTYFRHLYYVYAHILWSCTDENILENSYKLVTHVPDFLLWENRIVYFEQNLLLEVSNSFLPENY